MLSKIKICEVKSISVKMACLVCLLLVAVFYDIRTWKISNQLILISILAGFLYDVYEYGWTGIGIWLPGTFMPVLLLFPLFLLKVLGAGDIKLFSVIGSFYGVNYVLKSIVTAIILGAVISMIYLIKNKMLYKRFSYLFQYIQRLIKEKRVIEPYFDKRKGYEGAIHFSIPILGAVLLQNVLLYI